MSGFEHRDLDVKAFVFCHVKLIPIKVIIYYFFFLCASSLAKHFSSVVS